MGTHDHDDKQIRDLFREARKREETSTPSFEDVMAHEPAAGPSWFTRLWTGPGLKLAMGSLATVMIAVWAASVFTEQNRGNLQPVPIPVEEQVDLEEPEKSLPEAVPAPKPVQRSMVRPQAPEEQKELDSLGYLGKSERRDVADPGQASGSVVDGDVRDDAIVTMEAENAIASEPALRKEQEAWEKKAAAPLIAQGGKGDASTIFSYGETIVMAPGVQDAGGDGNPNARGSRSRDYKSIVGGINPNSIEELEVFGRDIEFNTESYAPIRENEFRGVVDHPLSTFSIDVDTASYANVRRYLQSGRMPPPDAVRIEELLNYFEYNDPAPRGNDPFSVNVEITDAPWNTSHRLARIGLKGREIRRGELEGSNLVFLLDVSGSMNSPNKLPLLKKAMGLLVDQLGRNDTVAIVVYAGASGMVLEPTSGNDKAAIREALERLSAGGGTNGGAGLRLAYDTARRNFLRGGVNRVILATDGDFNLGTTGKGELLDLIERYAQEDNISLTALGFGMGNYKDDMLEHLANQANGNYAYIDSLAEARKVLVEQVGGTLVTIAKDVKIQVEFNPAAVAAYRLIGYENRMLAKEDFNDDTKDAGEIGAGHSVTALYEIVPAGLEDAVPSPGVDPLKYQKPVTERKPTREAGNGESFTVKLRYKEPEGSRSRLMEVPVRDRGRGLRSASADLKFAAAVAAFGMKLRGSDYVADMSWNEIRRLAESGRDGDPGRYRAEFIELLRRVR